MKNLLLAAMMMIAAPLAFAASPTATLSVQIVPTAVGNSCDVGPPSLGPIPPGAVAAGFTRCLYNLDFAQLFNLNTVIDCKGAPTPLMYAVSDGPNNCNDYNIVSDAGVQALNIAYTPADAASGTLDSKISTTNYSPFNAGYTFPSSHYTEFVYRMSTNLWNTAYHPGFGFALLGDIWEWSPNAASGSAFTEMDDNENAYSSGSCCPSGTGVASWNQFGSGTIVPGPQVTPIFQNVSGYDFTIYGTYGARMVSDGSSTIQYCTYLSGAGTTHTGNVGCVNINGSVGGFNASNANNYSQRHLVIAEVGPQGIYAAPTGREDMYLARITVWGCANPGGTCNEPIPSP